MLQHSLAKILSSSQFLGSSSTVDQFHWTTGFTDGTPIDTLFADLMDLDPSGADIQGSVGSTA